MTVPVRLAWPGATGAGSTSDSNPLLRIDQALQLAGRVGGAQPLPQRADDVAQAGVVLAKRCAHRGLAQYLVQARRALQQRDLRVHILSQARALDAVDHQLLAGIRQPAHLHGGVQDCKQQRAGQKAQTEQQETVQRLGKQPAHQIILCQRRARCCEVSRDRGHAMADRSTARGTGAALSTRARAAICAPSAARWPRWHPGRRAADSSRAASGSARPGRSVPAGHRRAAAPP